MSRNAFDTISGAYRRVMPSESTVWNPSLNRAEILRDTSAQARMAYIEQLAQQGHDVSEETNDFLSEFDEHEGKSLRGMDRFNPMLDDKQNARRTERLAEIENEKNPMRRAHLKAAEHLEAAEDRKGHDEHQRLLAEQAARRSPYYLYDPDDYEEPDEGDGGTQPYEEV